MTDHLIASAAMATLLSLTATAGFAQSSTAAPGAMNAEQGWSSVSRCAQEETERARHNCVDRVLRDAGLLTNEMRATQQRRAFGLNEKAAAQATSAAPAVATASSGASVPAASAASSGTLAPAGATAPAVTTSPAAPSASTQGGASTSTGATKSIASTKAPAESAAAAPVANAAAGSAASAPSESPDRLDVQLTAVQKAANGRIFVTTSDGAVWLQTESVQMPLPPVVGDRMSIRKGSLGGYVCSVASTHLTYRCIRHR